MEINISEGLNLIGFILLLVGIEAAVAWLVYRKRKEYFGNFLVPASFIVLSLVFWGISRSFPKEEVGPVVIPQLWGTLLIAFSLYIIFTVIRKTSDKDPSTGNIRMIIVVLVLLLIYFMSMSIIGYFLASFLFLGILMYLLAYRNHKIIWTISTAWVLFSYLVFYKILYIQLPLGIVYETYFE